MDAPSKREARMSTTNALNETIETTADGSAWECARCMGADDAICHSCDKEWYNDVPFTNGFLNKDYTGCTLQCHGCER